MSTRLRLYLRSLRYWLLMQASLYLEVIYWEKTMRGERVRYTDQTYFCLYVRKLSYLLDVKEYACYCCPIEWGWFDNGRRKACFELSTVYTKYQTARTWQDRRTYARLVANAHRQAIPRWRRDNVLALIRKLWR